MTVQVESAMRSWLAKRRSGQDIMHDLDEKTSCLRPARSNTYRQSLQTNREKVEKCLDVMSAMESISQPPPAPGALSQPLLAAAPNTPAEMALPSPDAATGGDGLVSAPQQRQPPPQQQQQRSFAQNRAAMLQQHSRCSKCKMGLGKCRHLGLPGHLSTAPVAPAPAAPAATPGTAADCDLCCDTCDGWFRASNVGLSVREAEALQEWHCATCLGQPQPQPQPQQGSDGIDRAAAVQATGKAGHWLIKAVQAPGKPTLRLF